MTSGRIKDPAALMKTVVVSSRAEHQAAVADADRLGLRLACVLSAGLGKWLIGFMPASAFTDYSSTNGAA